MEQQASSAEQIYKTQADAALTAFQRSEISFAQWNRLQSDAANSFFSDKAEGRP